MVACPTNQLHFTTTKVMAKKNTSAVCCTTTYTASAINLNKALFCQEPLQSHFWPPILLSLPKQHLPGLCPLAPPEKRNPLQCRSSPIKQKSLGSEFTCLQDPFLPSELTKHVLKQQPVTSGGFAEVQLFKSLTQPAAAARRGAANSEILSRTAWYSVCLCLKMKLCSVSYIFSLFTVSRVFLPPWGSRITGSLSKGQQDPVCILGGKRSAMLLVIPSLLIACSFLITFATNKAIFTLVNKYP